MKRFGQLLKKASTAETRHKNQCPEG